MKTPFVQYSGRVSAIDIITNNMDRTKKLSESKCTYLMTIRYIFAIRYDRNLALFNQIGNVLLILVISAFLII